MTFCRLESLQTKPNVPLYVLFVYLYKNVVCHVSVSVWVRAYSTHIYRDNHCKVPTSYLTIRHRYDSRSDTVKFSSLLSFILRPVFFTFNLEIILIDSRIQMFIKHFFFNFVSSEYLLRVIIILWVLVRIFLDRIL